MEYVQQLQLIESALEQDPQNIQLLQAKKDLQEVINLTIQLDDGNKELEQNTDSEDSQTEWYNVPKRIRLEENEKPINPLIKKSFVTAGSLTSKNYSLSTTPASSENSFQEIGEWERFTKVSKKCILWF
jgi:hypothetical protein